MEPTAEEIRSDVKKIRADLRASTDRKERIRLDNLQRQLERDVPGEWDGIIPQWKVVFLMNHGSVGFYCEDYIAFIKSQQEDGLVGIAAVGTMVARMYPWHEVREIEVYKFRDAEIPEVKEKKPWWKHLPSIKIRKEK